jgi:uncharacterized protein (DUF2147 family)
MKVGIIGVALWTAAAATSVTANRRRSLGKVDASGRPEAWFRISECGGVYEGQIVKMFSKPGEDPSQWRCTKCEGEQKNAPVLGITFIKDMQRKGLTYENGTILDPRDGSVYNARMELSPDGKQLTVRGYLGIFYSVRAKSGGDFPTMHWSCPKSLPAPAMYERSDARTDRTISERTTFQEDARRGS